MEDATPERIASNDVIFRDANERIRASAERYGISELVPFICECAEPECAQVVRLSLSEYEAIRSDADLLLTATGHAGTADASGLVEATRGGYQIVRRGPRAAEVTPDRDPPVGSG
jgi:hypothetical protein